jgi:hypothetical protein
MSQYFNVENLSTEPMSLGMKLGEFQRFDFTSFPELPVLLPADPAKRKSWRGSIRRAARRLQHRAEAEATAWRAVEAAVADCIRAIEAGEQPPPRQPRDEEFRDCGIDPTRVLIHSVHFGQLMRLAELPEQTIRIYRNRCCAGDQK